MAQPKYFTVAPSIWGDPKLKAIDHVTFRLAFYVWTGPHRYSEGLFRLPVGYIVTDSGLSKSEVTHGIERLERDGYIMYDRHTEVCLDIHALRTSPVNNGRDRETGEVKLNKRIPGALRQLEQLPETPLFGEFLTLADLYSPDLATAIRNHFGTPPPSKPLRSPSEAPELGARSKEQGARQIGAGRNGVSERHTESSDCKCGSCTKARDERWAES